MTRFELTVSLSEVRRHFDFIVDAVLPHDGAIAVSRRGRVVAVLVAPWLWMTWGRIDALADRQQRRAIEVALRERYPRQFTRPISLEVGPGWLGLVGEMLAEVDAVLKRRRKRIAWRLIASKYASLRADFETPDYNKPWAKEIEAIVERYEVLSASRCERCGKRGTAVERGGWIWVACEEHAP